MGKISEILRGPELGSEAWDREEQVKYKKRKKYEGLEDEIKAIKNSLGRAKTEARKKELKERLLKREIELHKAMHDITKDTPKDMVRNTVGEIDKKVDNTKSRIEQIKEKYLG